MAAIEPPETDPAPRLLHRRPPAAALAWAAAPFGPGSRVVAVAPLASAWLANHAVDVADAAGRVHRLVLRRWARLGRRGPRLQRRPRGDRPGAAGPHAGAGASAAGGRPRRRRLRRARPAACPPPRRPARPGRRPPPPPPPPPPGGATPPPPPPPWSRAWPPPSPPSMRCPAQGRCLPTDASTTPSSCSPRPGRTDPRCGSGRSPWPPDRLRTTGPASSTATITRATRCGPVAG